MKKLKNMSELGKSLAALGIALVIGAVFIILSGESPINAYGALLKGALGSPRSIANTISKSIPLAFTGLAVALGSRCGMLNIGAEGQLHAGAMASVLTALALSSVLPAPLLLIVSILAGVLAGMIIGSIPGFFKAKLNTSEVIVAIMLNYICTLFTSYLVNGPVKAQGSTAQTQVIPEGVWFPRLIQKTQLTGALFLLIVMAAGAIAGLAGSYLSLSQNNLFVTDMTAGRGFMGLAANIFGGWQPLGSLGAGMVFAIAQAARFYLTDFSIPSQLVQMLPYVITLLILLFVGKRVKGPEALGKLVD